jgi:hypothetical protein
MYCEYKISIPRPILIQIAIVIMIANPDSFDSEDCGQFYSGLVNPAFFLRNA